MVLLSAHGGGRDGVQRTSRAGLLAGDRLDEITAQARALVDMFNKNFAKFEVHVDADVKAAAPALRQAAE